MLKLVEDVERESIFLRIRENENKTTRLHREMEMKAEIENIKAAVAQLQDDMDKFEIGSGPKCNHQRESEAPSFDTSTE